MNIFYATASLIGCTELKYGYRGSVMDLTKHKVNSYFSTDLSKIPGKLKGP